MVINSAINSPEDCIRWKSINKFIKGSLIENEMQIILNNSQWISYGILVVESLFYDKRLFFSKIFKAWLLRSCFPATIIASGFKWSALIVWNNLIRSFCMLHIWQYRMANYQISFSVSIQRQISPLRNLLQNWYVFFFFNIIVYDCNWSAGNENSQLTANLQSTKHPVLDFTVIF